MLEYKYGNGYSPSDEVYMEGFIQGHLGLYVNILKKKIRKGEEIEESWNGIWSNEDILYYIFKYPNLNGEKLVKRIMMETEYWLYFRYR